MSIKYASIFSAQIPKCSTSVRRKTLRNYLPQHSKMYANHISITAWFSQESSVVVVVWLRSQINKDNQLHRHRILRAYKLSKNQLSSCETIQSMRVLMIAATLKNLFDALSLSFFPSSHTFRMYNLRKTQINTKAKENFHPSGEDQTQSCN